MAAYDSSVIVTFADRLYQQAAGIEGAYAMAGAVVGGAVGGAIGAALPGGSALVVAVFGAAIIGVIAWQIGRQKAAALRLQAQVALCQVQIEANTRYLRNG
ncbi:MAG TPA: hypothetical protein VGQ46_17820 [Thermoanaerobaculia bacterium]|jgi:outer membrane lipoprotein SlyB|nr:hypothetical protein [Thermoanaerobaculia bacterium]